MPTIFKRLGVSLACFAIPAILPYFCLADDSRKSAQALLPAGISMYGEVRSPATLLELILEHPLRERLESLHAFQAFMGSEDIVKAKAGLSIFEASMGMRWPQAVKRVTAGGIYAAIDLETGGVVVLIHAGDSQVLSQLQATAFSFIRGGRPAGSEQDPIRTVTHGDRDIHTVGNDLHLTLLDDWLVITRQLELAEQVIDRFVDPLANPQSKPDTLADVPGFQKAVLSSSAGNAAAWAWVNVERIRNSGVAQQLYTGRSDNAVAELLFGGILDNLRHTPYATLHLAVRPQAIELSVQMPHQFDWIRQERTYFFGDNGSGIAPGLLQPQETLFALSSYRDLSQMWLRAGELMTAKATDELEKADTQLATFFAGKDFGEEILGSLGPEVQLVASRQNWGTNLPHPAIKLPAFAVRFRMLRPEETQRDFRRVFQSFVGFINIVGAMNGQPQFDMEQERSGHSEIVAASYVVAPEDREATDAAINYNFSPTIAFSKGHFILASSRSLADQLLDTSVSNVTSAGLNTAARLEMNVLSTILTENREQLLTQNMLEKGHSREEAVAEIDLLIKLLSFAKDAKLRLQSDPDEIGLRLAIELSAP